MARVSVKYLGAGSLSQVIRGRATKTRAKISAAVASLWQEKVMSSAISAQAKRRYADAITPYAPPKVGAHIGDYVSVLLERGWRAFDMTRGLLAGASHRAIPVGGDDGAVSVRTVSLRGRKGAWKHPGYRGAKAAARVQQSIGRLVREALADE